MWLGHSRVVTGSSPRGHSIPCDGALAAPVRICSIGLTCFTARTDRRSTATVWIVHEVEVECGYAVRCSHFCGHDASIWVEVHIRARFVQPRFFLRDEVEEGQPGLGHWDLCAHAWHQLARNGCASVVYCFVSCPLHSNIICRMQQPLTGGTRALHVDGDPSYAYARRAIFGRQATKASDKAGGVA